MSESPSTPTGKKSKPFYYGTPVPGSKTEARAKKAHSKISAEILQLCDIIERNGQENLSRSHPNNVHRSLQHLRSHQASKKWNFRLRTVNTTKKNCFSNWILSSLQKFQKVLPKIVLFTVTNWWEFYFGLASTNCWTFREKLCSRVVTTTSKFGFSKRQNKSRRN